MENLLLMSLPTLSPDFSGVCSTLFELEGIIAIHDPGGCTGSYTGYDEPRWFDQKSKIFTTSLDDVEAVFGDDSIVVKKICIADEELGSRFIAFLGSPSPMVIGTDYAALAKILHQKTGKTVLPFDTKGTEFYDIGIEMALLTIAKTFLPKEIPQKKRWSVNILGATPLDITNSRNLDVIRTILTNAGYIIESSWCMNSGLDQIRESACAGCNIVLTVSALKTAQYLWKKYGTPYVIGSFSGEIAVDDFLNELSEAIESSAGMDRSNSVVDGSAESVEPREKNPDITSKTKQYEPVALADHRKSALIVGEQFISNGIRNFLKKDLRYQKVDVASFFMMNQDYMEAEDRSGLSEELFISLMSSGSYDVIIGDPLLANMLDKRFSGKFVEIPHVSISSRLHWNTDVCQFGRKAFQLLK